MNKFQGNETLLQFKLMAEDNFSVISDSLEGEISRRGFLKGLGIGLALPLLRNTNRFTYATGSSRQIQIGMVADVHYADMEPLFGIAPRKAKKRFSYFTKAMNEWDPDFIIELGDLVNGRLKSLSTEDTLADLDQIENIYNNFVDDRYYVLGNHELYCLSKPQFQEHTGMDYNYRSFDLGEYHFVILDAQYDYSTGQERGQDPFYMTGYIPEAERNWLEQDLKLTKKPTVIFTHQRLDILDPQNVRNAPEVRSILEDNREVVAVFQGHDHKNSYKEINGIHYVTLEALVDPPKGSAWAKVLMDPAKSRIIIDGYSHQASYKLSY